MKRVGNGLALVALLAVWIGCGSDFESGAGGSGGTTSASGSGGDGGTGTGTTSSGSGAGGSGGAGGEVTSTGGQGGASDCVAGEFGVVADTAIMDAQCNGANHTGESQFVHLGPYGRGLFRFAVDGAVGLVLAGGGQIAQLQLELTRDLDCISGEQCPTAAGQLLAFPLRNDWAEGSDGDATFEAYAGADWCRREAGQEGAPWGANGAAGGADAGPQSGAVNVTAAQTSTTLDLDGAAHEAWLTPDVETVTLAVKVHAGAGALFMAASRENGIEKPARLHVVACPQ